MHSMTARFHILSYIVVAVFLSAPNVFAAGGGGGGGVPMCSEDVWVCTDWSSCSASGSESRKCSISFDCTVVDTPKPDEMRACTPPPPPPPPPPIVSTPPSVSEEKSAPAATCTASKWECGAWSVSCDANGLQHRACRLANECPGSPTPSPSTTKACDHLQCANKAALHDRISCRLNLAPAGVAQELKLQYLPEECRAMSDGKERQECIVRYKAYTPCWNIPAGEGRFACARNVLGLKDSVAEELAACAGTQSAECKQNAREKVLYMIKFRFYDLNERAEELVSRGADINAVADLEAAIEGKKQEFNMATTTESLRQIVLDVRASWLRFVNQVKNNVQ